MKSKPEKVDRKLRTLKFHPKTGNYSKKEIDKIVEQCFKLMKRKKVDNYISKCCKAKVTTKISPDFPNDNPDFMEIGTCNFYCSKCLKPCGVVINIKLGKKK